MWHICEPCTCTPCRTHTCMHCAHMCPVWYRHMYTLCTCVQEKCKHTHALCTHVHHAVPAHVCTAHACTLQHQHTHTPRMYVHCSTSTRTHCACMYTAAPAHARATHVCTLCSTSTHMQHKHTACMCITSYKYRYGSCMCIVCGTWHTHALCTCRPCAVNSTCTGHIHAPLGM